MSENTNELRDMLLSFRVSELQTLLGYAGKNKSGRKTELQERALELLRIREHPINSKIKELYKSVQLQTAPGALPNNNNQPQTQAAPVSNTMPQQQPNSSRNTATVHPFVDSRLQATRQAQAAAAAIYSQQNMAAAQNLYYPQYTAPKPNQMMANNFPIHPDVRFKRLPFYDILADLIKPSSLVPQTNSRMQEQPFYFHLTPQQATDIACSRDIRPGVKCDYVKQVQLRFALLETTCEQEDCFPPQVMVKVNNKLCPLPNPIPTNKPGVEPKRPPRPVNITAMVKLSPTVGNQITVSWAADYGRGFALTVALVHKLTSSDLLQRLKNKGAKHADHTRALIKEKLNDDGDCEIATTSLRVSLMCPLGKMRMATPCRPITCSHLQCFDASLFLQMNERKPTWNCPVCDKPALYDNLVIDGYFQEVLSSSTLPNDCNEIQLLKDGSWSSHNPEKKPIKTEKVAAITTSIAIDDSIEIIEDNDPVTVDTTTSTPASETKPIEPEKKKVVVDLTLSDSDDDEPLAKKRATARADSTIKSSVETQSISSSSASDHRSTPGPSSVTSSGYPASPGIINLDSPSPPSTPQPQAQPSSCMVLDQQSNGGGSNSSTSGDQQPQLPEEPSAAGFTSPNMPFLDLEQEASGNVNFGEF